MSHTFKLVVQNYARDASEYRARLNECWALLIEYKALLIECTAPWFECRAINPDMHRDIDRYPKTQIRRFTILSRSIWRDMSPSYV